MKFPGFVLHPDGLAALERFSEKPAHAALLTGPHGIGKTHLARMLAGQLLAAQSLENHAYYQQVAATNNTIAIEQIRTLIGFFRLRVPGTAPIKRVAVIQDGETMSREAQNALLKLLEEPPEGSVLIVTSSQPERLLTTIRSRTQQVALPAPDTDALLQHFATLGYDQTAVKRTVLRTGTDVAEAARLLESPAEAADDALLLVKQVLGGGTYDRMLLVDGLSKQKEQAASFVSTLTATAMASLQAAATKNPAAIPRWQSILEASVQAHDALERNGNTKIVLTELMLAL